MYKEIEATFKNINKDEIRTNLRNIGASLEKEEFMQKRVVFNLPDLQRSSTQNLRFKSINNHHFIIFNKVQKLEVSNLDDAKEIVKIINSKDIRSRTNKGWLRIRDEGRRITMTYKRQDNSLIEGMFEIEIIVNNFDQAFEFLNYLGCNYKAYQETKRETWRFQEVEITIDEWPYLEPFVEIEGNSEDDVKKVSTLLGFDWQKAYFGAVDRLYADKYGISENQVNNSTPRILFNEPNPFIN